MSIATVRREIDPAPKVSSPVVDWQILTGEYPPQPGGVSDYTRHVARSLAAAGDGVDVWAPPCAGDDPRDPGVIVRRLPDRFGPWSLHALGRHLERLPAPRRLLVQYVPQAFGWKGLNLPFGLWLRSRRRDSIWVVFHEVAFPIARDQGLRGNVLGGGTRLMAALVARGAERAFVSIPAWAPLVTSLAGPGLPVTWLPVPSSIDVGTDGPAVARLRERYADGRPLVGHFGTCGSLVRAELEPSVPQLLAAIDCRLLLLGRGSDEFALALIDRYPGLSGRIHGTGSLDPADVSRHVSACDLMLQPYPDGVSSRRTSVMVALSHGRPVVTTSGALTEPIWRETGAVALVAAADPLALASEAASLLGDTARQRDLSVRARTLYDSQFDVRHTVEALRSSVSVSKGTQR